MTEEKERTRNRELFAILGEFGDKCYANMPDMLLRGISVHQAEYLTGIFAQRLPEMYLTLHHAKEFQLHPRLRGWSARPKIGESSGHADWGQNSEIALFEAYIGKPREYWVPNGDWRNVEPPLAMRIHEDMDFVEKEILRSVEPEIFVCDKNWTWDKPWAKETKLYKMK